MSEALSRLPVDADVETPSAARVYDYYLGGGHNFPADREFANKVIAVMPAAPEVARLNRAFLRRAVRHCARAGIRQFLDIGSGILTIGGAGNVGEFAASVAPDCRVVYTDIEPIAVGHGRAALADHPFAAMIEGDIRDPDLLVADPDVRGLLDFDQPIAVLMLGVLHYLRDDEAPHELVRRYHALMAPGSFLVLSHGTDEHKPEPVQAMIDLSKISQNPAYMRGRQDVGRFLDGFEVLDPGVVVLPEWRPEPSDEVGSDLARMAAYAAVGRRT
ncbi:SAM-dependent methyltransferase [Umezawaea sp. NPDC059074]|uniref:SAM-dependent methyltransferase n=1 Tax=Umezawaea sp. NPDC059074 TaxID=3346716 RepID=UPI0036BBC991